LLATDVPGILRPAERRVGDDLVGVTIDGRYEVLAFASDEVLGRVWFARDARGGRTTRIKVFRRDLLEDEDRFERFQREVEAFGRVRAPGVLRLFDTGVYRSSDGVGLTWAAFEGVPERTLVEISGGRPVAWDRVARLLERVAIGLAALHAEGVVHRDLIGRNVLVDERDHVHVRDLGLAFFGDADASALTQEGQRLGHRSAMAPEYGATGEITPAVDLYALGVLAWELLTAEPVKRQGGVLAKQQQSGGPPSSRVPDVPRWLDQLVMSLLERHPSDRPTADAAVAKLRAGRAAPPVSAGAPDARWGLRLGLLAASALVLVAGIGTGVVWSSRRGAAAAPQLAVDPYTEVWLARSDRPLAPMQLLRTREAARAEAPAVVDAGAGVEISAATRTLVSVDGQQVGFTPVRVFAAPGTHTLAFAPEAGPRREADVDLVAGTVRPMDASP
jgi:hypothetical protein